MDEGAHRSTMGIQKHPSDNHTRNTIQPDIRDRGDDPSRSGRAHHTKANVRRHPKRGKPSGQPRLGKRVARQEQDPIDRMQA